MNIVWKGAHPNNFEKGRRGKSIKFIIIHWFGVGNLEGANARFNNATAQVSAHYGISDNTVWQWVKDEDTAYHAGNFDINLQSVGIEHDATTTKNATDTTYKQSAELVAYLCKKYNIPFDRVFIRKHSEIKPTECPGSLDIDRIIRDAKTLSQPSEDIGQLKEKIKKLEEEKTALWQDKQRMFTAITQARDILNKVNS